MATLEAHEPEHRFELTLLGWEFDRWEVPDDALWLDCRVLLRRPGFEITGEEPLLQRPEIEELAESLDGWLRKGGHVEPPVFMEPGLEIEMYPHRRSDRFWELEIAYAPATPDQARTHEDSRTLMRCTRNQLRGFVRGLHADLKKLQPR